MSIFPSRMGPIYQCAKIRAIIWFLDLGSPDEPTLPLPIVPRSLNDEKPVTRLHILLRIDFKLSTHSSFEEKVRFI